MKKSISLSLFQNSALIRKNRNEDDEDENIKQRKELFFRKKIIFKSIKSRQI
jgi:hypothetical protein